MLGCSPHNLQQVLFRSAYGVQWPLLRSHAPADLESCNVVWTTPSKDAAGSMPLGNGAGRPEPVGRGKRRSAILRQPHRLTQRNLAAPETRQSSRVAFAQSVQSRRAFQAGTPPARRTLRDHGGQRRSTSHTAHLRRCQSARGVCPWRVGLPLSVKVSIESWRTARRACPKPKTLGVDHARRTLRVDRVGRRISPPASPMLWRGITATRIRSCRRR